MPVRYGGPTLGLGIDPGDGIGRGHGKRGVKSQGRVARLNEGARRSTVARFPASASKAMTAIPRYRAQSGPAVLSAGFRPFFLVASVWAAVAIPLWLELYSGRASLPTLLQPLVWHVHEMVFGYAAATVAGFLLTAVPNWTGRLPLQGGPLAVLIGLWTVGRLAVLFSGAIGPIAAAVADLSFPTVFLAVVAREIIAGRNWRNAPVMAALALLLAGNLLVHLAALDIADTAELGNRLGLATLLMLIALVGGRIIPSFTRNWLVKTQPAVTAPTAEGVFDRAVLALTALALLVWVYDPYGTLAVAAELAAGIGLTLRLARWRGLRTLREPLLLVLHLGYAWLALGLLFLGLDRLLLFLPPTAALHALTVGAIGTMTLAVMTRASLGHTGRPLKAGPVTIAIYLLITLAAVLRVLSPLSDEHAAMLLYAAGAAWSAAFGLFAIFYGRALTLARVRDEAVRPI